MNTRQAIEKLDTSYIGDNFKECFYPLSFNAKTKKKVLISKKLPRAMNDGEIFKELNPREVSMEEIVATLKTMSHNFYALFYCRDVTGTLRAVGVYWDDVGWSVYADDVACPFAWDGDYQVFSRQFLNAKTLGSSDPLTLEPLVARIKSLEEDMEKIKRLINI